MLDRQSATEQAVRYCGRCEGEQGKGIVDPGDHACSACGAHDAPHVYVPTDDAAVERVAKQLCANDGGEWATCVAHRVHREDARNALVAAGRAE